MNTGRSSGSVLYCRASDGGWFFGLVDTRLLWHFGCSGIVRSKCCVRCLSAVQV